MRAERRRTERIAECTPFFDEPAVFIDERRIETLALLRAPSQRMIAGNPMVFTRRSMFWSWFAAAWLPVLGINYLAFHTQGRWTVAMTALAAAINVLPDALLGIGTVYVNGWLWQRAARRRLAVYIVASGTVFTIVATSLKVTLNILMVRLDGGNLNWAHYDHSILVWQAFFSMLAFAVLTSVTFALAAAASLRQEEIRRSQAELLRARSELKALRAQLNPHFLFNTLHSVRALISENPAAAEEALEHLGDLLRYVLRIQDAADEGVLLAEEWEFVQVYLSLEQLRLGERLHVEAEVADAALQGVVPAFVLQPLVENAIRHGIAVRKCGGTVWIRAQLEEGALHLQVRNDGPDKDEPPTKGTGKGLELLRQRLRVLYGAAGSVDVAASAESGFSVTLRFPAAMESW